jgi:Pyruvate/2-oxoacid:ferredoxin oxidoreductase delta subunit
MTMLARLASMLHRARRAVADPPQHAMSRRDLFRGLLPRAPAAAPVAAATATVAPADRVARIQPFDCLAGTGCATCRERCPEEGAIALAGRSMRVVSDRCTGCGICHDVCPAPRNPIIILPRSVAVRTGAA